MDAPTRPLGARIHVQSVIQAAAAGLLKCYD